MSTISTHILDTARGKPANGVAVYLESQKTDESWEQLTHAWTDEEGRVKPFFLLEEPLPAGTYRLVFDTEAYFSALDSELLLPAGVRGIHDRGRPSALSHSAFD